MITASELSSTQRLRKGYELVEQSGILGLTVADLRYMTDTHHGSASSVLSTLHKEGRICRLAMRRDGCSLYVTPDKVGNRETKPYGRRKSPFAATVDQDEDLNEQYEQGYKDGQVVLRRQITSVLNRHGSMAGSRLFIDLRNLLDRA